VAFENGVKIRSRAHALLALVAALLLPVLLLIFRDAIRLPLDSDGRFLTYQNAFVRDANGLRQLWTHDFFAGAETGTGYTYDSGYYRPLTNTLLWIEYRLAATTDWQYNLHGVLVHWLNCVLLAWLLWELSGSLAAALLAAVLFGVHPVNAFAATQTKARADVLFATFYLGALIAYVRAWSSAAQRRWVGVGVAALLYAAALLSKETAATLPLLLVLLHLLRLPAAVPRDWRRGLLWTLPFWIVLAAYAAVRLGVLDIWPYSDVAGYAERYSALVLYANVLKNVSIYVLRMVLPYGADYAELCPNLVNFVDPTLRDPLIWLSVVLVIALPLAALRVRRQAPVVAFLIALFLVTMAPLLAAKNAAGTLSPDVILAQERWAYLPSAAAMALIAWALAAGVGAAWACGRGWAALTAVLIVAALAALGSMAAVHAREADSSMALLKQYLVVPEDKLGRLERVNKLILSAQLLFLPRGDLATAEQRCREAVALAPDSPIPAAALAYVLVVRERWTEVLPVVAPWYQPKEDWLAAQHRTNMRVLDDLNRVNPEIAFYTAGALAHTGHGAEAMRALCDALRRGHNATQIRNAAAEAYALYGPPRCRLATEQKSCLLHALPGAMERLRPFLQPSECGHLPDLLETIASP